MPSSFKLSPSSLNLLEDCPRCFWLDLVKGVPRPQGIFPSLPSGVDRLLKGHFDSFMRRRELPPELREECADAALFSDEALLSEWRNNFRGIKWLDPQSGVLLRGAVDNLLEQDGKLVVLDFKTRGFPLKDDTAHHYADQMNLYNFLLRKNGFATEDHSLLLFYIPESIRASTGEFVFRTQLVRMPVDVHHAERLFRKGVAVLHGPKPASSPQCAYCAWSGKVAEENTSRQMQL